MPEELSEAEVAAMGRAAGAGISAGRPPRGDRARERVPRGLAALDALPLDGIAPVPAAPHPTELP